MSFWLSYEGCYYNFVKTDGNFSNTGFLSKLRIVPITCSTMLGHLPKKRK